MRNLPRQQRRPGATVVECAFVLPLTFFLMLTLMVGGMGIFRYQECATLAREGARYASTHGAQYRKDSNLATGTKDEWKQDIYTQAIKPRLIALDESRLTYSVTYPDVVNQAGKPDNWPGSQVSVTVNYYWIPAWGPFPSVQMTSTSSMPITN